jgi:hypothetical protein
VISVPLNQSHCPPWRNRDEEVAHKIHLSHEGKEESRPWLGNYALVITWKDSLALCFFHCLLPRSDRDD